MADDINKFSIVGIAAIKICTHIGCCKSHDYFKPIIELYLSYLRFVSVLTNYMT